MTFLNCQQKRLKQIEHKTKPDISFPIYNGNVILLEICRKHIIITGVHEFSLGNIKRISGKDRQPKT